jgi:hypothetical protein
MRARTNFAISRMMKAVTRAQSGSLPQAKAKAVVNAVSPRFPVFIKNLRLGSMVDRPGNG